MKCRHCRTPLKLTFLDLGSAPPSNAYLSTGDLTQPEISYPLRLLVCTNCRLVQTEDHAGADELFTPDYAYFSSTSASWLAHAADYCRMIRERLRLDARSFVIEVASNDGYLLRNFVAAGIPCLGIEPTNSTAEAAKALGIPVLERFFGKDLGRELLERHQQADLIIGNNVYAHVPDINDFTVGLRTALKPAGVVTLEFPHLMRLVQFCQFDTVYHEHFSYLSLHTVSRIFATVGLRIFDVEELSTHGGSLRVHGCREEAEYVQTEAVAALMAEEDARGMNTNGWYRTFQDRANAVKNGLLSFLLEQKRRGKTVAGYGAAAKGNTLLNYAGVKPDLLPFISDAAPSKIGKFMPGSHIPILSPDALRARRPDYLLILPWNIATEIKQQNAHLAKAGTRFVIAVPELEVL
uniref:Methyltransferase domain-containing protein n=1 Tax=Candidatus Kentrum sp. FW TaxID=2126338 RepID=A0A450U3U1_9GAMM|nr:MAG: Methyltransferase domain-containing protein [Candidatus Kentron sp. FW]